MSKFSKVRIPAPKTSARAAGPLVATVTGRPRGGRAGNPERFTPLTVYIDKPVYQAFKARLAFEEGRNFSDVLTELMREWTERSAARPPSANI